MQYQAKVGIVGIVGISYGEHVLTLLVTSSMYVPRYFLSFPSDTLFSHLIGTKRASKRGRPERSHQQWQILVRS